VDRRGDCHFHETHARGTLLQLRSVHETPVRSFRDDTMKMDGWRLSAPDLSSTEDCGDRLVRVDWPVWAKAWGR
jgi:hypothetical protein